MKEQVIKFEKILNESQEIIDEVQKALEKLAHNQKNYQALVDYYSSDEYKKDVEISNSTHEYDDIPSGVLSEDAVFNLIASTRETANTMSQLSEDILKKS